jgi:alkylation response protein AidB-like acyl-CoA dehydrogenase
MQEPELRRQFMRIFADFQALRRLIRVLLREDREEGRWSMTPSLVKWSSTKIANRLGELRVRLEGMSSQIIPEAGPETVAMYDFLDTFGGMIAGGSNEIMRNLIAERALGMPR